MRELWMFLLVVFGHQLFAQTEIRHIQTTPLEIGERLSFHSEVLQEERLLNVYLPNSYSENAGETYPVIYLLDGGLEEDFIHIAGLVQFGSFSWIKMLPESILVGISNVDRKRDFTFPTQNKRDQKDFPTSGKSESFIRFISQEIQPLIRKTYSVNTTETLIGQSFGGLLATEILLKQPSLFDNYIIVSPALWWDDESLLHIQAQAMSEVRSVYVAVGKEGEVMERTARDLYEKVKGLSEDKPFTFFEFYEACSHGDVLHLAVYDAFKQIFSK